MHFHLYVHLHVGIGLIRDAGHRKQNLITTTGARRCCAGNITEALIKRTADRMGELQLIGLGYRFMVL